MSQEVRQTALQEQTQQLLQGPLKHVRAAALAAALLPLASVAAAPVAAQDCAESSAGTICGFVWNDTDGDVIPGTQYDYAAAAQDCTPSLSSQSAALSVTAP